MATQVKHRRGTAAEIAAGIPAIGELWFNTTDNTIHMGDGVTQGGIKQTGVVNVKNYGAKGDGLTDDTGAIQSALDTGGTVFFPKGSYRITSSLTISSRDQLIYGVGLKSVVKQTTDNTDVFVLVNGVSAGVHIRDLLITGEGDFTVSGVGIRSEYAGDLKFTRITVTNLYSHCYIDTRTLVATSDVWFFQCKAFDTNGPGFHINNGTQIYFTKCDALSCERGFKFSAGSAYHMTDCLSLFNTVHGVEFSGGIDWVFLNTVECDANGISGFRFSDCRGFALSNCWAGSSGEDGYLFLSNNSRFNVSTSKAVANDNHGWNIQSLTDSVFSACSGIDNNKDTGTNRAGFFVVGNTVDFIGCDSSNDDGSFQSYGFQIGGSAADINIIGGDVSGNSITPVNDSSGVAVIRNLTGYVTESNGTATVPAAIGSVTVPHGLASTPDTVQVTPLNDTGSIRYWVGSRNATTFTIQFNATTGSDVDFDWEARFKQ